MVGAAQWFLYVDVVNELFLLITKYNTLVPLVGSNTRRGVKVSLQYTYICDIQHLYIPMAWLNTLVHSRTPLTALSFSLLCMSGLR